MARHAALVILAVLASTVAACSSLRFAPGTPYFSQVGIASWYGAFHHGRRTANGERFDMGAMTAAHRSLPMHTVVRVTNLDNGRTVKVRINDRGPYVRGRILDLSSQAARALEMREDGLSRVRIEAFESDQRGG